MEAPSSESAAVHESDLLFDCPHCGKSLVIDGQATGLMITCPDCQAPVQVPVAIRREAPVTRSPVGAHLDLIGNEIGVIQSSLDRIVTILTDASRISSRY